MKPCRLSIPWLAIALILQIAIARAGNVSAAERGHPQTITLGIVSETHRSQIQERFQGLARYLAERLSAPSKYRGEVLVAPTPFELAKLIDQRRVDFYMESPYPTYLVNDVHGVAKLLLRRWKSGMSEYRSLIFTSKSAKISRLEDLKGKVLVFEDPVSTSGYFLAKSFLLQKGYKFIDKSRFDPYGSPTDIGYLFAHTQEKLFEMVLANKAAAGVCSDDDYARLDDGQKAAIRILAQTDRLPRHFVSVRKGFSPALTDQLKTILLSMHENPEGRNILKNTDDTTKFDLIPEGEAMASHRLAEIFRVVERN